MDGSESVQIEALELRWVTHVGIVHPHESIRGVVFGEMLLELSKTAGTSLLDLQAIGFILLTERLKFTVRSAMYLFSWIRE